MDNESSTEVGAGAIVASLGDSIIDALRTAMGGKSKASGDETLSVVHAMELAGRRSVRFSIDSGVDSCEISVGTKPRGSRQLINRRWIFWSRIWVCVSRGTVEISRGRTAKDSSSLSLVRQWYNEGGLSEPSSRLGPEATLRLVIERLDSAIRGFRELLRSKLKGETLGFRPMDLFLAFHCVMQMKGALCGSTARVRGKRKRGSAETLEGLRVSAGEDADEYVEVLEKLKKMGWSEDNDEDSKYLEILKKMKNLME